MAKDVAIITLHGMGSTQTDYYRNLERKLRKVVGATTWDARVHLQPVYYQDLLQGRQEDVWDDMDDEHDLRWDFLRQFMLFAFSDAASIEHSLQTPDQTLYKAVHQRIAEAFDKSFVELGNEAKPVILIAQSLGCEQASNYIWDAMTGKRFFEGPSTVSSELDAFRRLGSCTHFVTTGCNIPIFKSGLTTPEIFARPRPDLVWHNYFDKDDVLGYPMRQMGAPFKVNWLLDHEISVGGFLTGWNPVSHLKYWTDKDLIRPVGDYIEGHLAGQSMSAP